MMAGFASHLANAGYVLAEMPAADGRLHRVSWGTSGKRDKSGWIVAWDHGDWASAVWGDWRDGVSSTWCSRESRQLSPAARVVFAERIAAARAAVEAAVEAAQAAAESRAWAIWRRAELDVAGHPYLERKGMSGTGLRRDGEWLLVPLRDADGLLKNVQRIDAAGEKRFVREAAVEGLAWLAGSLPTTGDVVICEGSATADTVREVSGVVTVAAMNAGNLMAVATWVRERCPAVRIIIAADDDRWERDGTPRAAEKNIGRVKAAAAAAAVKGVVVVPVFCDITSRGTDWNDLWLEEGKVSARAKWDIGLKVAGLDATIAVMSESEYQQRKPALTAAYRSAGAGNVGPKILDQKRKEAQTASVANSDESPAAVLSKLAAEPELWHDQFGVALATFDLDGRRVNARLDGQLFRDWLRMAYEDDPSAGGVPPGREIINSCIEQAAARARARGARRDSFVRVGWGDGVRWLDLGRDDWSAVRIDAAGWSVVEQPDVKFVRGEGDVALPVPVRGVEGLNLLWRLLNVAEADRCLIAGWLLGTLVGDAPSFGLNLHGTQGTAKSTATRILRRLIDPAPGLTQPLNQKRVEELPLTCLDQWIPCFENISWLEDDVQDALCMLTTGLSLKNRKLYSDASMVSYNVRRPWIINGINNVCSRNDLAERAVPVGLLTLAADARRTEAEVESDFEEAWPELLGCLLDAVSMASSPEVRGAADALLKKEGLSHRMADALLFITAGEEALGFAAGSFIRRLTSLQEEAGREALENHPAVLAIQHLLSEVQEKTNVWTTGPEHQWTGTIEEIMSAMEDFCPGKKLPKGCEDGRRTGMWLKREAGRLRVAFGIEVGDPHARRTGSNVDRVRTISKL